MVNNLDKQLDRAFAALAHPARRAILERLSHGNCPVGELAEPFDISWPAVTKHLRVLERAGLVRRERDGRVHRMHLEAEPMCKLSIWIERYRDFWEGRLDSLARYLEPAEAGDNPEEPS